MLGPVADRGAWTQRCPLPHPAQDVMGQHRKGHGQAVAVKLTRGQVFEIQVSLELAVALFASEALTLSTGASPVSS